jgi:hypothetical protein
MSNEALMFQIDGAKDDLGVITPKALHDQLGSLTPADWQQASLVFSKSAATKQDGFYIEDNKGAVSIHNDMSDAQAHTNVLQSSVNDAKNSLADTAVNTAVVTGFFSVLGGGMVMGEGAAMIAATALGGAELGAGLAVAGAVVGTGIDLVHNVVLKSAAENDLRSPSTLSFTAH